MMQKKKLAKYIPCLLQLKFQGMLEEVHTRKKVAHSSYTDMEQLDFQILLFDNYYIFPYLLSYENQEKN